MPGRPLGRHRCRRHSIINSREFYPLVLLFYLTQPNSKGNRVPADIRIVEASSDLRFDRSLLTGERLVIAL